MNFLETFSKRIRITPFGGGKVEFKQTGRYTLIICLGNFAADVCGGNIPGRCSGLFLLGTVVWGLFVGGQFSGGVFWEAIVWGSFPRVVEGVFWEAVF